MKTLAAPPARALAHRHATALVHDEPHARVVAFRLDPHQQVPTHSSPSTVLVVVTEGEGTFSGADGEVTLRAGQAVAYEPGEPHAMSAGEGSLAFLAIITPRPV